jgi:putative YhbY family RNA-binding protein
MITSSIKRRIKRELSAERPTIWIGKNGMSKEILAEIDSQLERTEMVKAKILTTALGETKAKAIAAEIAQKTDSLLVEVRGHTFILYRKKKKER